MSETIVQIQDSTEWPRGQNPAFNLPMVLLPSFLLCCSVMPTWFLKSVAIKINVWRSQSCIRKKEGEFGSKKLLLLSNHWTTKEASGLRGAAVAAVATSASVSALQITSYTLLSKKKDIFLANKIGGGKKRKEERKFGSVWFSLPTYCVTGRQTHIEK